MKKLQSNKGFTLVELIIVIAILAIIMLIAIPNFSGIQQRMQVRADKATAAQIGKAVRVWYTDYTTDAALKASITDESATDKFLNDGEVVVYSTLTGLDAYCSTEYAPSSLLDKTTNKAVADQKYYVGLVTDTNGASYICVMIGTDGKEPTVPTESTDGKVNETYDGVLDITNNPSNIAYVEPGATVAKKSE